MKFANHISLSLFILTLVSCAKAGMELKYPVASPLPHYINKRIKNNESLFKGQTLRLNGERLPGWYIEELKLDRYGFDIYKEKYKNKRERLFENVKTETEHDIYDPLSSFDYTVNACDGWLGFLLKRYHLPAGRQGVDFYDGTCYRLIKITGAGARTYDVILFLNRDSEFLNEEDEGDSLLNGDIAYLSQTSNGPYTYDGAIFRMAKFVEPKIQLISKTEDFVLLQFTARRYFARSGILHFEFGKLRVLDTHILMITAKKIKVVIQTFYSPNIEAAEIESDLEAIINAFTIH